ncbi:MAG: SDR family oxidoreductase [Lentimicrobium sp.]|uniref:SDR family NAD(P)-dependent oxidoreductase n=1 Tax=Lentimicrobium sp. TaxID=2034841 RepID=UPI0025D0AA55|nr:SDR family oxidoreductase [Lentimicrobium sp.]MCO5257618.1 SDR family oxidoreductase [Lentimicrobium sp.]
MKNPFSLVGKNIVVTGASSGIGRQTAVICSQMGARVVLIARNNERLKETLSLMQSPENHLVYSIDLAELSGIEAAIKEAVEKMGKLHGLVNAAGISTTLPLKLISNDKLDEFFKTNVYSAVLMSRLFTKQAIVSNEGGSVIMFSSVMGIVGETGKTLYSLTKGALISAAKSMALEFASKKIRFNAISPGVVVTPMSQNAVYSQDEESLNKITALHPLGLGMPDDIANACVYLLSDASRWVTGSNLVVDGGYTAR